MLTTRRDIQIEWGDCDPAGIVFYPRYFAFFDACTAGHFANAGLPKSEMLKHYDIVGIPMVDTRAKFIVPSRFGDVVTIETRIKEFRRSSFDVEHRLVKGDILAIEAWETRVWVGRHPDDPEAIKAREIPADVIERFK
ncbi:MAG: acyl-CoA thioesterase [Rhodomicrobiaceae bacterium]